jgi:hypothetical protein
MRKTTMTEFFKRKAEDAPAVTAPGEPLAAHSPDADAGPESPAGSDAENKRARRDTPTTLRLGETSSPPSPEPPPSSTTPTPASIDDVPEPDAAEPGMEMTLRQLSAERHAQLLKENEPVVNMWPTPSNAFDLLDLQREDARWCRASWEAPSGLPPLSALPRSAAPYGYFEKVCVGSAAHSSSFVIYSDEARSKV